ncbi:MAG TPA: hypothetical protein VE548_00060 [Nitrososphaeraceae archaeon]|nr:hypothetical protein [Nitrososphaeraceae archaeon]
MSKTNTGILWCASAVSLSTLRVLTFTLESLQGIIFEARNLTDLEKQIAEKDYLSTVEK